MNHEAGNIYAAPDQFLTNINPIDYVNLQEFIQKTIPSVKEKAFAPLTAFKAFEEFLANKGESLEKPNLFSKMFGENNMEKVKESLKGIARATQDYREMPTEENYNSSTKQGKKAFADFIYYAGQAGVKSETIVQSVAVFGAVAGFEVDLKHVRKMDFRPSKGDQDFMNVAKAIANVSISLREPSMKEEEKSNDEILDNIVAAEAEGKTSGRKVDIEFGEIDVEDALKKVTASMSSKSEAPYRSEKLKGSINRITKP